MGRGRFSDRALSVGKRIVIKQGSSGGGTYVLTGAAIATALGYTPYDSANPAGYITSAGSITSSDVTTALGYVPAKLSGGNVFTGQQVFDGTGYVHADVKGTTGSGFELYIGASQIGYLEAFGTTTQLSGNADTIVYGVDSLLLDTDGDAQIYLAGNDVAISGNVTFDIPLVPQTRSILTTAPLTGGGNLTANRTLSITAATTSAAGSMSAADKTKLDGIATGATANTGTVTGVTGTSPINSSGGTAPVISFNFAVANTFTANQTVTKTTAGGEGAFFNLINSNATANGTVGIDFSVNTNGAGVRSARIYAQADGSGGNALVFSPNAPGAGHAEAMRLTSAGKIKLATLVNATSDAIAAGAGVAVGEVYRNGSVLMIRVS